MNDPATGQPMAFDQAGKFINANGEVTYRPEAFLRCGTVMVTFVIHVMDIFK